MTKSLNFESVGRENDFFSKLRVKEMFYKNIHINICAWILLATYVLLCLLGSRRKKANTFKSYRII